MQNTAMNKVQPIRDNILIKPLESEEKSEGGILVPGSFRARNNKAMVIAVGNGTAKRPMRYKPGQIVHGIKDCGDEIIIDGEKHFIVKDSYLLASEN